MADSGSPVSASKLETALSATDEQPAEDQRLDVKDDDASASDRGDTRGVNRQPVIAPVVLGLGVVLIAVGLPLLYHSEIKDFGLHFKDDTAKHVARVLIALGALVSCAALFSLANKPPLSSWKAELEFKLFNDKLAKDEKALDELLFCNDVGLPPDIAKAAQQKRTELQAVEDKKAKEKQEALHADVKRRVQAAEDTKSLNHAQNRMRPLVYVIDMNVDVEASQVDLLRHMVSLLLRSATPGVDEVVVILDNSGGTVHGHGLCASQLWRLRQAGISLTVAVDKIAASGGYMMASVANKIIAAPFSIIGSIGVLSMMVNVQKALEDRGVDAYLFTAGEHKRTVDFIGEVTEEGKKKEQEQLHAIHAQFKRFVAKGRPQIGDIEAVATGEWWMGEEALEKGLVDEIGTSDDYLMEKARTQDVLMLQRKKRVSFVNQLADATGASVLAGLTSAWSRIRFGLQPAGANHPALAVSSRLGGCQPMAMAGGLGAAAAGATSAANKQHQA